MSKSGKHEYELTTEKSVYENRNTSYRIEVITDNYACYKDLREGVSAVVAEYENAEEEKTEETVNGN